MKWVIIISGVILVFIVVIKLVDGGASIGQSDFDQAKDMCGSKGVAHFSYNYQSADGTEQPDVTCK